MKTWFHSVGKTHYTKKSFSEEAMQHGVTRRIAPRHLDTKNFGDRVLLGIKDGKSTLVFGFFIIERVSGLSNEAIQKLQSEFETELKTEGGYIIDRGCGICCVGKTLSINASIPEIAKALDDVENPGPLMIGGTFFPHEEVRLSSMEKAIRGFRLFDYEQFLLDTEEAKQTWNGRGYPSVKGYFYAKDEDFDEEVIDPQSEVQHVIDYVAA